MTPEQIRSLLTALGVHLCDRIIDQRQSNDTNPWSDVVEVTAADTIFFIDKIAEKVILAWFEANWPADFPVRLIMEGLPDEQITIIPKQNKPSNPKGTIILDPIDGTRMIMHDKRSAWVLLAFAPSLNPTPTLADLSVAAMVEIPTSKQGKMDVISAIRGLGPQGVKTERMSVNGIHSETVSLQPSQAQDLTHGFASICSFFPTPATSSKELETKFWARLQQNEFPSDPKIYFDQYISTGGQIYELISGHDRFIADLRPLFLDPTKKKKSLTCHPYDIATALIAEELGCIICDLEGSPLQNHLNTTEPVLWIGYANKILFQKIHPHLREVFQNIN